MPRISIVNLRLILWYIKYFHGGRTVDSLRYWVFRLLVYCWNLEIPSIDSWRTVELWDTEYFDGWRTTNSLTYWVYRFLAYCRYFDTLSIWEWTYNWNIEMLSISIVDVLLIFGILSILIVTHCWFFKMQSISMFDVLLILWDTWYFYGWRTVDTMRCWVFRCLTYC